MDGDKGGHTRMPDDVHTDGAHKNFYYGFDKGTPTARRATSAAGKRELAKHRSSRLQMLHPTTARRCCPTMTRNTPRKPDIRRAGGRPASPHECEECARATPSKRTQTRMPHDDCDRQATPSPLDRRI